MKIRLKIYKIKNINELLSISEDELPVVSVSCGVAFGEEDISIKEIFSAADEALYNVKKSGGNGCKISTVNYYSKAKK